MIHPYSIVRLKLPYKEITAHKDIRRVLYYNPSELYLRIIHKIHPYLRYQPKLYVQDMFPSKDGFCACGCNTPLSGRRTRWADKSHSDIPYYIWCIIVGKTYVTTSFMLDYQGNFCKHCGIEFTNRNQYNLDHIIPVYAGGGGCWLSNYQLLCKDCHKLKTKQDRLIY